MNACPFLPTRCMGFFFRGVSARSSWFDSCTKCLQVREERKAIRPKNRSEQVLLLRSLIDEASELPPIPLSPAYQRRWALEFEGQSLKTYRRLPEDSRYCSLHDFQHLAQIMFHSYYHKCICSAHPRTDGTSLSCLWEEFSAARLTGHL